MKNQDLSLPLFNSAESKRQRDRGIAVAASYPADEWVARARQVAELLAAKNGETDIDSVLAVCPRPKNISHQANGSIFKGGRFVCVGITQSTQVSRHAGLIRRWALK